MKLQKWFVFFALLILFGCHSGEQNKKEAYIKLGNDAIVDQTKADEAKKIVSEMEEVVSVKGVALENNLYIAPQVTQFARLKLEKIRKESFDKIKNVYPEANVHVSTDKKIYLELGKLENKLQAKKISMEDLEKKLKKLEEDMKG